MSALQTVSTVIATTGIKPAKSYTHEVLRGITVLGIIGLVYWSISKTDEPDVALCDVSDVIKPGTIMYQSIDEMDEDTQKQYLKSFKQIVGKDPSIVSKYIKNIKIALVAGIASEYIINGNLSKPLGIISKTILYSLLSSSVASI